MSTEVLFPDRTTGKTLECLSETLHCVLEQVGCVPLEAASAPHPFSICPSLSLLMRCSSSGKNCILGYKSSRSVQWVCVLLTHCFKVGCVVSSGMEIMLDSLVNQWLFELLLLVSNQSSHFMQPLASSQRGNLYFKPKYILRPAVTVACVVSTHNISPKKITSAAREMTVNGIIPLNRWKMNNSSVSKADNL